MDRSERPAAILGLVGGDYHAAARRDRERERERERERIVDYARVTMAAQITIAETIESDGRDRRARRRPITGKAPGQMLRWRRWYRSLMYTRSSVTHESAKAFPRNMHRRVRLPPPEGHGMPTKQLGDTHRNESGDRAVLSTRALTGPCPRGSSGFPRWRFRHRASRSQSLSGLLSGKPLSRGVFSGNKDALFADRLIPWRIRMRHFRPDVYLSE